jgi:hypothetical protein
MLKNLIFSCLTLLLSASAMPMANPAHAAAGDRQSVIEAGHVVRPRFADGDKIMSIRADRILPHHRFKHSLGAPLVRIKGTVEHVFPSPSNHHGANHQHFTVKVDQVLKVEGADASAIGPVVFVAMRFGDDEGVDHEIEDLRENTPIELQGEYVSSAEAYKTEDNEGNPPLPVLHFTHHPVGYVIYNGDHYS